eukprot:CAMPEP_0179140982 /NCGR_PEP_ID=MMETSP0796-20121207/67568_1 /TAXON_ID=73915 /ORGANISM="Pyrodinium bahamense, Strain pbaha01" /LENGTH=71 /DNA_ID=CAMNT_0020840625 /DNA_START=14 /DNA_END=229 /DNA_ORIENTATION=-
MVSWGLATPWPSCSLESLVVATCNVDAVGGAGAALATTAVMRASVRAARCPSRLRVACQRAQACCWSTAFS